MTALLKSKGCIINIFYFIHKNFKADKSILCDIVTSGQNSSQNLQNNQFHSQICCDNCHCNQTVHQSLPKRNADFTQKHEKAYDQANQIDHEAYAQMLHRQNLRIDGLSDSFESLWVYICFLQMSYDSCADHLVDFSIECFIERIESVKLESDEHCHHAFI